jgi:hypothetical protein
MSSNHVLVMIMIMIIPAFLSAIITIGIDNPLTKSKSVILRSAKWERAIRNVIQTKNILDMVRLSAAIFNTSDMMIGEFETESLFSIWDDSRITICAINRNRSAILQA